MDLFQKCKELYEKIRYFEYGIPVDGVIKPVPSPEYFAKNYHFLKPEEFEKYKGGICWDYVEYERKFLEVNDIDFNQYYLITNTPPNYDTHTFITVKDGDELIYIESSFKRVEHIIDGVQKFKTLEDIVRLITTNMWYCNDNDKHFDEFKYDVCKFKGHPQYGCTCEEYMKWMDDNSDIVIKDTTINPKKVNNDELTVESVNLFQEGLFNFGKPKEPVNVMAKLSETFGELSPAQSDIINRLTNDHNPMGRFDFFVTPYSKYYYDMTIRMRKLDSFLKKESVLIGSAIGVPEGSVPIGMIDIIPDIDNVIKNYEAYEDGQLEYEDYYELYMDDPRYGLAKVRVYADQNGAIYTCLSQDGKYTQVAKSYDEFVSKFNTYKFKLNKNEFVVSRRYSSRDGFDVFSVGLNTGDAEYTTTYTIDSDDIHTVALLYARFISFGTTQIFDPDADGDDEPTDFPVGYESYKQIETACAEHGVDKPFYPKMKVVELTFHKAPEPDESYFVPSKLTYVFALNESLDKPFMTVDVKNGEVTDIKFNDTTIKEYVDPEEYDETLHDHIDDEDDVYNESFKSDMRKKNVQLQRKNKVTEMNEMKQAIRKHVEHAKDGTLVLNATEIDPKNLPKEIKFTKNLITEIPATTEERAVKWIKRKLENMQFNMDLYKEAEKEFKSTNDYKAKDRMNEYKELLLNDNNFLMNNFNFSAFEFTKPDVKETLMFNQAIRYLAELVNKMNDFNIKSKRQEIASLLGTKYGDDVVIMAKAGKPTITWNNSFSPNYVDIRLSKRANKVYQDADKSLFIHFSKYEGLTELNPGVKSNYGDFTKFGNGKWFYKNPCVHFFAFRLGKFGAHITKQHLKQLMDVYGSHFYVYKPQASDKIYYDVMETGHSSSIYVHGIDAVFIETNKPLPVKEYSVDVFPILNDNNRNKNSMITLKESYTDDEEYDETLHDHIADEDDVYNEASVLKFPKKVNNVPFDIMYFGSNIDFGNESIKLDHNELFLTPYIGLASIFITDRKEYFKPLPKDRPHNTNIGYDEWGLSPSELQKPLKEVHVSLDDIPNVTPFEFDYTGYIYAIDVSQYKNNLYQKDWMTSDREFILKDINPVPIKEKIKWTHHVYVRGGKNTDGVFNESWTDFKNGVHPSSGLMFHVSLKNDMDGKTINPQLPSYITDGGELDDNYQEDTKTKRLCVSPSIEGCLIAILSYNKIREHVGDKFYVYTPEKPFSQYKHKTNKEIVKDKLVFDANITKESWILEPCKLKLYGIIKLKKVKDLKKKPTVEKNIKMNTIKLDYEWIMTPKASGKFNKAIGDSPDKEDDTKAKPIKEYDNILVSNDEFFMEAKSFKQTIREEQTKNTRVSNVNSESKFKAIFKDYLSNIDVPSYPNTIQFKNPDKIDKNVISSKKFDIDTYRSAFTHLKSLYNKLLSAIKNNDLVHSKSYRNKIGELIGRSIENNTIFIDINEGNIEINIGAKTFRKLNSSKYDLFVHRSNNPNLSSIKPTIGTVSGTGIFMYKSSVVYMFAFEKTSDVNKRKKQFEIFDHYISSSYGDNLYLYKPTSSNVFCIDDNLMKRPGLPFNASMIPVNIETKNPLPVTKISESELKKLLNIEDDAKEKPINEYAVPGSFYHDIKPHPGGVYALVEDDSYRSHFCHIDFQGHDNKYLGWNAPTGSELILKTQEVIKSEKWEFRKSETDTIIPEYTHIFTYAQQILPIIRLDKIKDRLRDLLAPYCPLTVHDPNSDTDIEYVCIQPQQYEVIDKEKTSYVYDTAYKHMFENHIVYLPIVDNLGMFEVKHTTHVAGTYDDNLFFEELFYGPTISYKLFDAFKDLNSVTLYDISDINAWDFACDYEDHYDEDGERIEPGDPKHPSNKQVNESTNVLVSNEEFFGLMK